MEVANWNGPNINRTSTRLGLRSEASARFEKGLAPEQAMEAQAVATRLMVELCGARLVEGTVDVGGVPEPPAATLRLRDARVQRLLGVEVPRERSAEVLGALGFGVGRRRSDGLTSTVPHWRRDDVTPRGRPHRGGRAARGARAPAGHDPREPHGPARRA